jgi:hypothetical protein
MNDWSLYFYPKKHTSDANKKNVNHKGTGTMQYSFPGLKILFAWRFLLAAVMLATCSSTDPVPAEGELKLIHELPEILSENSGMIEYNGLLWFVNDGDNDAALFGFNATSGVLERQLQIVGTENIDWEEMTQDEDHIYIGDFGNNAGSRDDLRIIILDKEDMGVSEEITPSGMISFDYADQIDFTPTSQQTSFDCEAFLVMEDSILLFTKDWATEQTSVYSLPVSAGEHQAVLRERFDSAGLVTGSAYLPAEEKLVLIGYSNYMPFLWIVNNFSLQHLEFMNPVRIDFPSSFAVQTEAVVLSDENILVSSEKTAIFPAQLFRATY